MSSAKDFPKFDRLLYGNPYKMFEGWVLDDFLPFLESPQNVRTMSMARINLNWIDVPGWVDIPTQFYKPYSRVQLNANTSWEFSYLEDDFSPPTDIEVTPLEHNRLLFPYTIKVTSDGLRFIRHSSTGHTSLIQKAMLNSHLPLSEALLLEAFTGVPDNTFMPLLNVESAGVGELFGSGDIPFDVLETSLLSLVGGVEMMGEGYVDLLRFADVVRVEGVG